LGILTLAKTEKHISVSKYHSQGAQRQYVNVRLAWSPKQKPGGCLP
jgi:hypothetical protein